MNAFYREIAEKYLEEYKNADAAKNGYNGPYRQEETYIRNTAHWIISFSIMYTKTKDIKYKNVLSRFSYTLLHDVQSSENGAVFCIMKDSDPTNGLIGLAWAIEGLIEAYTALNDSAFLDAAEKIYFSQSFDNNLHTWRIVGPDGIERGIDIAFNHSLWFCMTAAKLIHQRKNSKIEEEVLDYLSHVGSQFLIYENGLISHFIINNDSYKWNMKMRLRKRICAITGKGVPGKRWNSIEYERSYHLFSLYAFAWLYHFYPQASFFQSRKFNKLKVYGLNEDNFIAFPEMNSYAYGYNSPAYELPLIHYFFKTGKDSECAEHTLMLHKKYNIASDESSYTENVRDAITLDARVYEIMQYYRLKEETHE